MCTKICTESLQVARDTIVLCKRLYERICEPDVPLSPFQILIFTPLVNDFSTSQHAEQKSFLRNVQLQIYLKQATRV